MPNVARAFGGPTESLIGYAQAAGMKKIDVHVAAPSVSDADRAWLQRQLPNTTFRWFASVGQHAYVMAPGLWRWLVRNVRWFDIVHVHGLFNPVSSLSARIAISRGVPTIIRPFGTLSRYTFSRRSAFKRIYFRWVDCPALQSAAGLHFTTIAERNEADRLPLDLDGRSHVVPPPWRSTVPEITWDAKAECPTVLYLSRLHSKKNVGSLIESWKYVVEAQSEAQLWIAGDGPAEYVQKLQEMVRSHHLDDSVSFLGFVSGDKKKRVLREAWVFALPSHQENFGIAVLEAIAAGLPVVISREVQLRAFVEKHDLGVVVDRTTKTAIANGLRTFLSSFARRRAVAEAGPAAVKDTFSVDQVGKQVRAMYEQAVSSS